MRTISFLWTSIWLALACWLWGWVDRAFAIPGQTHIMLWLPVGFVFVGFWLAGPRAGLGALLGLLAALVIRTPPESAPAWLSTVGLALSYWVQTLLVTQILRRAQPALDQPLTVRQIVLFLLWIGPVHTVFAAWVSPVFAGMPEANLGQFFVREGLRTWWRDSVSCIVTTTAFLSLCGRSSGCWRDRRWTVGLPLLIAMCMVLVGVWLAAARDHQVGQRKFEAEARLAQIRIQEQVDRTIKTATQSWYYTVERTKQLDSEKSRDVLWSHLLSFRSFSPELVNVAYCPVVPHAKRAEFEQMLSSGADLPFVIKDHLPDGSVIPAPPRAVYVPNVVQGLWFKDSTYLGLDLLNDPDRGPAIRAALDQRKSTSTGLIPIISSGSPIPVNVVICPQTNDFDVPPGVVPPPRPANPESILVLVFDVQRLLQGYKADISGLTIEFEGVQPSHNAAEGLTLSQPILFADRTMNLKLHADFHYLHRNREHTADSLAFISYAVLLILVGLFMIITGQTLLQQAQVDHQLVALRQEASARELTEAWLRRSESRLSQAQLIARLGYWEWDVEQNRIYCSHSLAKLFGDETSIILDFDRFLQRLHPDDRQRFVDRLQGFGSQPDESSIEVRLIRPDGSILWVLCVIVMTGNDHGPSLRGTVQDITTLKQNQLALEAQELRLRVALAAADMGTWEWDLQTNRLSWDDRQQQLYGFTPGTFDGQLSTFIARLHPDERDFVNRLTAPQATPCTNLREQFRILLPDGSIRWIEAHSYVLQGPDGQPARVIGVNYDITSRKETELALLASQAHLAQAQHLARLGSWEWNPVTRAGHWSSAFYEILKLDPALPAQYPLEASWIHPADAPIVERARRQLLQPGVCCKLEFRALRPDQSVVHLSLEACHEWLPHSHQHRLLGIIQDISERKLAEEQRRQFDERLQEIQRLESLGILAGGVAHDFNNLLTGILGNAMLALEQLPPDSELVDFIRPIEKSAQHAADLCQQLLAYAGRGTVARGIVSINNLIRESEELLRLSVPRQVRLDLNLASDLEPLEADASRLRQVLINLVQNAGEAIGTKPGRILIQTEAEPNAVILHIEDTGCGMDPATVARIFEPFFTTKFAGRGIGLSAVHGIVAHHKGTWDIRSTPGQGSTFRIRFPVAGTAKNSPTTEMNRGSTDAPTQADGPTLNRSAVTIGLSATLQAIVKTSLQSLDLPTLEFPIEQLQHPVDWPTFLGSQTVLLIADWAALVPSQQSLFDWIQQHNPNLRLMVVCPEDANPDWDWLQQHNLITLTPPLRTLELVTLVREMLGAEQTEPG